MTFLMVNIVQIILTVIVMLIQPDLIVSDWFDFFLIAVSFYLVGFPLFYFMTRKLPDGKVRESHKLSIKKLMKYGCVSYATVYVINLITVFVMYLIELLKSHQIINPVEELVSTGNPFLTLLCVVIISPIIEELIFRKIMLNKLRDYGDRISILVTSITFGLYHGNFSQLFYAAALGAIFSYIVLKTNRIQYTIMLHMFINAMGSLILPFLMSGDSWIQQAQLAGLLVIIIVVLGLFFIIKNYKKVTLLRGSINLPKEHQFDIVWGNPGMVSYIIITVGLSLLVLNLV